MQFTEQNSTMQCLLSKVYTLVQSRMIYSEDFRRSLEDDFQRRNEKSRGLPNSITRRLSELANSRLSLHILIYVSFSIVNQLSNRKRFPWLHSQILPREGLGEFETVMQTRDEVEGLHNCREFSQPLEWLYQAMQTQEKSFLLLL